MCQKTYILFWQEISLDRQTHTLETQDHIGLHIHIYKITHEHAHMLNTHAHFLKHTHTQYMGVIQVEQGAI